MRVQEVGLHEGVVLGEAAGGGVVAVALLADGEADDAHARIGHAGEEPLAIRRHDEKLGDGADDAVAGALGAGDGQRVEAVLRGQRVAGGGAAQACGDDAPRRVGGQQVVDHRRLVGAVEGADAEMDDAGRDARTVVGGAGDGGRQPTERGVREARQRHAGVRVQRKSDGSQRERAGMYVTSISTAREAQ